MVISWTTVVLSVFVVVDDVIVKELNEFHAGRIYLPTIMRAPPTTTTQILVLSLSSSRWMWV